MNSLTALLTALSSKSNSAATRFAWSASVMLRLCWVLKVPTNSTCCSGFGQIAGSFRTIGFRRVKEGACLLVTVRKTACGRWGAKKPVPSASSRTRKVTTVWVAKGLLVGPGRSEHALCVGLWSGRVALLERDSELVLILPRGVQL
jgi:hypothetical protein